MFISHLFKTEYLKNDKLAKTNYVGVDPEILKTFSKITKIIKINNIFNINSITDFYILQLMILEHDFTICYTQREKYFTDTLLKDEIISTKDEEIKFLKERIKFYENSSTSNNNDNKNNTNINTNNEKQLEIFENELKMIRERLIAKTSEFVKFETQQKELQQKNKSRLSELIENQNNFSEENNKLKSIISDIIFAHKKGNEKDLKNILNHTAEDLNFHNFENFHKNNNLHNNSNLSMSRGSFDNQNDEFSGFGNNFESPFNQLNNNSQFQDDNSFVKKVINEFDKILNDEYKRAERHHKTIQSSPQKMRSSMSSSRYSSSGKNYVEYKPRSSSVDWFESLRGSPEPFNSPKKEQKKVDLGKLVNESKGKIKSSIKNIENLFKQTKPEISKESAENLLKSNQQQFFEMFNLGGAYNDKFGGSYSPKNKDVNVKKNIKKENDMRE
jgi:hypothetical protein